MLLKVEGRACRLAKARLKHLHIKVRNIFRIPIAECVDLRLKRILQYGRLGTVIYRLREFP